MGIHGIWAVLNFPGRRKETEVLRWKIPGVGYPENQMGMGSESPDSAPHHVQGTEIGFHYVECFLQQNL